jgi:hypothetical protein
MKLRKTHRRSQIEEKPSRYLVYNWHTFVLIACVVLIASWFLYNLVQPSRPTARLDGHLVSSVAVPPLTLEELGNLSDTELNAIDLSELNFACLRGLPETKAVKIEVCARQLERWTLSVRLQTEANLYRYFANPTEFENSEAFFRMLMLVTVLQQDYGVGYNLARVEDVDFRKPSDLFVHGLLGYGEGGTCVSIPTVYADIAQRLGYPVYLVYAKQHLFCRWDGLGARFNIEGTNQGMNSYPDAHYMKWPLAISAEEVRSGQYLKNLNKRESLAAFLAIRGHCLEDNGLTDEARDSYQLAMQLAPAQEQYKHFKKRISQSTAQHFLQEQGGKDRTVFLPSGSPHIIPGGSAIITAEDIKARSDPYLSFYGGTSR